ncbi:hypothetical protein J2W35_006930 [Variovorax boronicumulans]|uniref:hypothetical protein n=1 Tax=Variovorax boronicumulans TaxID=436515 RepID=UPI002780F6E2|nr:hypothetical protein [Variovorax boronicumulans]MDQ0086547.1 hypothetical protein [Variovorax boronicumulans]
MNIDENLKRILEKVDSGELDKYLPQIEGSDLGFQIPTEFRDGTLQLMSEGFSQNESNLKISVVRADALKSDDSYVVGWMGNSGEKPVQCRGAHSSCTGHCEKHGGPIKNCSACTRVNSELVAPQLDYDAAVEQLENRRDLLNSLAKDGIGLALLHGHNSEFTFTKLPLDYVSVIANGQTSFRKLSDVQNDPNFVPTVWRAVDGKIQVAGGHSDW